MLNRAVSFIAALAMALGITLTGDAATGWTAMIPPLPVLMSGAFEALKQFTTQQLIFDGIVSPKRVRVANGGSAARPED